MYTFTKAIFREDFIPRSNKTSRPGYRMTPTHITIHNTGNSRKGANAEMHTRYVDNTDKYVSWHFTVDDKYVFQELPTGEVGWHAGNKKGNRCSIGIEICEQPGIDWEQSKQNAIELVVQLMEQYNIPIENVVPHKYWSGKYCPHKILDEGWDLFVDSIKEEAKKNEEPDWLTDLMVKAHEAGLFTSESWIGDKKELMEVWASVAMDMNLNTKIDSNKDEIKELKKEIEVLKSKCKQ